MAVRCSAAEQVIDEEKGSRRGSLFLFAFCAYRFGGIALGGVEVVVPLCPTPFDEPVLSGLLDGGIAGSGVTVGETGVASGFVPGTVLGVVFGVKFGLVPGVTFGLVPGVTFGLVPGIGFGATGVVSGGVALAG